MNYLDLIIIYLACGSPFGVYYFVNNRTTKPAILLKSIIIVFSWIPYALLLLHGKVTNLLNKTILIEENLHLLKFQKEFENFLPDDTNEISLFELREIIERYTELTLISNDYDGIPAKHEKEIFRLNCNKNIEISAICLNRRNHKRLLFHQTQARKDFLNTLKILIKINSDLKNLAEHSLDFVNILNDDIAENSIKNLFEYSRQTNLKLTVNHWEKDLWTTQELKQSKENQISMHL